MNSGHTILGGDEDILVRLLTLGLPHCQPCLLAVDPCVFSRLCLELELDKKLDPISLGQPLAITSPLHYGFPPTQLDLVRIPFSIMPLFLVSLPVTHC